MIDLDRIPQSIPKKEYSTNAERDLNIISYIKRAIRNQDIYLTSDIEMCDAFLDGIKTECEIDLAWHNYWDEKNNK